MAKPFQVRQAAFDRWHADNPGIWAYFQKFSLEAVSKGQRRISHWLIINRIRWEVFIVTTGKDFKISNDMIAFYARLWRKQYPEYKELFKIKRMQGEILDVSGDENAIT
jgi:hypothetical protein